MASHARYLTGPLGKHTRPKVIEIRQLTVLQGRQPVLRNITLDIFEGESGALLGPPDSGKSALLACIQGQLQPTTGELHVLGAALPPLPPEIRRQIGFLPAQLDRNTHESVAAYLRRFSLYHGIQLNSMQIRDYCAHYQLSPSMLVRELTTLQARIYALALALVHDPRLVLLDEPLAGLAEQDQAAFWTSLQRTQREGRTLLCTFTPPLAEKYLSGYDLVVRVKQGRLSRQEA